MPFEESTVVKVRRFLGEFHAELVRGLEALDGGRFRRDRWTHHGGGGGLTCVLQDGALFERATAGLSDIRGVRLPPAATAGRHETAGRPFRMMGVSSILHPRNPFVPTAHMNVRFMVASGDGKPPAWWFGGGLDLTPHFGFKEDAVHFHRTCHDALSPEPGLHRAFKAACDAYFFNTLRREARGVGGLFYDDFSEGGFERCFAVAKSVARAFLPAYAPIAQRRRARRYGSKQRAFQAWRRSRYVEFNLLLDRGTRFGLQAGGRVESILASLPPTAAWRYGGSPDPAAQTRLAKVFLTPRDWLGEETS